ncbi:hypothetical protein GCM10022214_75930 [Actinomadura miaoliensis]|uniref:Uncharacterized protein n=1 Tax=Actinomadura miaoliensis TaxID=430685 RepID=A0ABP7WYZ1_9ACTN
MTGSCGVSRSPPVSHNTDTRTAAAPAADKGTSHLGRVGGVVDVEARTRQMLIPASDNRQAAARHRPVLGGLAHRRAQRLPPILARVSLMA